MAGKTYGNGIWVKDIETKYGQLTKLSFKVEDFVNFLQENENDEGYVNLVVATSKEGNKYTYIDDWKPDGEKKTVKKEDKKEEDEEEDIPF